LVGFAIRNTVPALDDPGDTMRVGLFVTCLADLMRPRVGFAALKLLHGAGCEVVVPASQTCCGQPAYSAGDRSATRALALKLIDEFAGCDHVVLPSGSCAATIRQDYADVFRGEPRNAARAADLAAKTYELTDFLVSVLRVDAVPGDFSGEISYHDSCSGLRNLGIKQQPRALLARMPGVVLREMAAAEECCGFGGAFAFKYGDISARIAERKCASIQAAGAKAVVGGDLGCLLNIEGRLRRMGDETTRVLHVAEVLAGDLD
jgi:L-lactate dehydrogenase complex protein LldE